MARTPSAIFRRKLLCATDAAGVLGADRAGRAGTRCQPHSRPSRPAARRAQRHLADAIATGLSSASPGTYLASGEIGDNNYHELDVDLFRVQVNAGDLLHVDVDAEAFGSTLDSELRIFDANGHPVACDDDDIRGGFDSHLEYYARTSGTYYVGVSCSVNLVYDPFVAGTGNFAKQLGRIHG